jgi:hypothetical protein
MLSNCVDKSLTKYRHSTKPCLLEHLMLTYGRFAEPRLTCVSGVSDLGCKSYAGVLWHSMREYAC